MTDLQTKQNTNVKDTYQQALEMHCKVMASREQIANALVDFAQNLKAMRDGKLYLELGYENFDNYIENAVHVGKRQVYKYISVYEKLGSTVLQSNAQLGVEKLALLTEISDLERADFIEDNDLEGMSTRELKELIEKSKQQEEQISFLQQQVTHEKEKVCEFGELQTKLDQLEKENKELRNRPVEVAVAEPSKEDIEKIKAQIQLKAEQEKKQAVKDAQEKARIIAEKGHLKALEEERLKAKEEATEEIKKALQQSEIEKAELIERAQRMAKELEVKGDSDMVAIKFLFENFQADFIKLTDKLSEISNLDNEKSKAMIGAVMTYVSDFIIPALTEI